MLLGLLTAVTAETAGKGQAPAHLSQIAGAVLLALDDRVEHARAVQVQSDAPRPAQLADLLQRCMAVPRAAALVGGVL